MLGYSCTRWCTTLPVLPGTAPPRVHRRPHYPARHHPTSGNAARKPPALTRTVAERAVSGTSVTDTRFTVGPAFSPERLFPALKNTSFRHSLPFLDSRVHGSPRDRLRKNRRKRRKWTRLVLFYRGIRPFSPLSSRIATFCPSVTACYRHIQACQSRVLTAS